MNKFLRSILDNVRNWTEIYLWVPVSFLSIYLMALAAYGLSGRAPRMNLDWFPELGVNLFKIVCAIALTSIVKEALWNWLSVKDKLEAPLYAWGRMLLEVVVLLAFLYVLFNR